LHKAAGGTPALLHWLGFLNHKSLIRFKAC
jgi:hypothetical protein